MHPDLMRKIDYYIGIPLTFLATLLMKGCRLFRSPAQPKPDKILFIELSEMGSTILADPAMRKAQQCFKGQLFFVIFKKNRPSLNLLHTVPEENIFCIRETSLFTICSDLIRFTFWCRRQKIDTTVDLELFSRFSALLAWLSGAANRSGFHAFHNEGLYRGDILTHKVAYNPHLHIAKNFIALVNALNTDRPQVPYSKTLIEDQELTLPIRTFKTADKIRMQAKITELYQPLADKPETKIVLINPNSSELLPQRRWPQEKYITLTTVILEFTADCIVLITGSLEEWRGSQALVEQVNNPRCLNFTGTLELEELPLLYDLATLLITNDSGPGHFSAVTRMPTIVLFGPETPALYGSLGNFIPVYAGLACSPCVNAANHRKTPCTDNVCMQVIHPEEVFAKAKPFLL
ncbi:MAG: glycosyltransferase family 9 protein [Proteobacteria bacterium]|nr:glycosyltransferase family 9 protein [Pseudomonadota bacterium]MBU1686720.1 glycosyltransferase family 9 protein [Pseudomonadota bacterium]